MARFPVITSPCPLRWASLPTPGRDHCGQCDRQVHNLDAMTPAQREAFLGSCSGQVCVAYTVQRRVQRRNVALGAGLVAALAGSAAAAAPAHADPPITIDHADLAAADELDTRELFDVQVTGGTVDPEGVRWAEADDIDTSAVDALPEITASDWLPTPR
jgi:hypothetical protein